MDAGRRRRSRARGGLAIRTRARAVGGPPCASQCPSASKEKPSPSAASFSKAPMNFRTSRGEGPSSRPLGRPERSVVGAWASLPTSRRVSAPWVTMSWTSSRTNSSIHPARHWCVPWVRSGHRRWSRAWRLIV